MPFAGSKKKSYLCTVKRIEYISPIDYIRGSLSGSQTPLYTSNEVKGYSVPVGDIEPAVNYKPILVAKILRPYDLNRIKIFQVRTRTSVNMTANQHRNLALMGGVGALVASLLRNKTAAIYGACVAATPKGYTLRGFVSPLIRAGLAAKSASITIADGVTIVNPWISNETPNVPVSQIILDKFADELSNS